MEGGVLHLSLFCFALFGGLLTTSVAQPWLLNSSTLEMFVDQLPHLPKILAYDVVSGVPKSKSLEIGMFNKKWVSCPFLFSPFYLISCFFFFFFSFFFLFFGVKCMFSVVKFHFLEKIISLKFFFDVWLVRKNHQWRKITGNEILLLVGRQDSGHCCLILAMKTRIRQLWPNSKQFRQHLGCLESCDRIPKFKGPSATDSGYQQTPMPGSGRFPQMCLRE
jgi:hypothetical protein